MQKDYLKELEHLGVTARIKRLSDSLHYNIKELYNSQNIEIEPSWHLVLLILKKEKQKSMKEIADLLNLTKPATTKMIKKMELKGYVEITSDKDDSRKKLLQLTSKAKKEMPKLEKVWVAGQSAVKEILKNNIHFMTALTEFEIQQNEKSFKERAIKKLRQK